MCVVSMVIGNQLDNWNNLLNPMNMEPPVTDKEIREFRQLLKRAKEYDIKHHEPHCEDADKKAALKAAAKVLNINIDFIDEK